MFRQNNSNSSGKKQTTLSFATKPSSVNKAVDAAVKSYRKAPYARPESRRPPTASASTTSTKSEYFGNLQAAKVTTVVGPGRMSRADSFGANVSIAVSKAVSSDNAQGINGRGRHVNKVVYPSNNVKLSERQLEAFNLAVNSGKSMFITGSAGTGKSVLLREIIRAFKEELRLSNEEIQITASTGIAAFNVGGKTIHSFSGVGYGKGTSADILKTVMKNRNAVKRWSQIQVLIIDEISMVDANLFGALESAAREIRKSQTFFGGIQVILTGDFYQLPPVDREGASRFAFECDTWVKGVQTTVVLTHVFRQKDMRFVDMLNELRLGRLSQESLNIFRGLSRVPNYPSDGIQPTELYALRNQVDDANRRRLAALAGDASVFSAYDGYADSKQSGPGPNEEIRRKIDTWSMAPRKIEIKKLAQVMLLKNMPEQGLVNGSRGVVTGYEAIGARSYPTVRFTNGMELTLTPESWEVDLGFQKFTRTQIPIVLAWALSIHKSQGQTIDRLIVDLGKVFERGQAYVALSRAVNLDSLQVLRFEERCVMVHERVKQYYAELARKL